MSSTKLSVRRLVTGEDENGKSLFESDGASPHLTEISPDGAFACVDIWRTDQAPSAARAPDQLTVPASLAPNPGGSICRVMRFPPEGKMKAVHERASLNEGDASADEASAKADRSVHPMMHKTNSVDYAIVISGEIWAIMDHEERVMRPGDVLVQRATSHAWANRSSEPCVIAFVLVDANDC